MKIIFLDTLPIRRGAQVFLHDLSKEIISKGHQVKKVYLYAGVGKGTLHLNEEDVVLNGNDNNILEKFPTINPFLYLKLRKEIKNFQPDLILLNGSRTLKYGAFLKKITGRKQILVYRIIDSVSFWNPHVYKQIYYRRLVIPMIDAAVGVSKVSLTDVQKLHNFTKPAKVIHRAISMEEFSKVPSRAMMRKKFNLKEEDKVVLFLGNLTPQKRPDRYLQVIERLRNNHPHLKSWIVGDGVLRQENERMVQDLKLSDIVTFWGYQQKVGEYIAASDILLLTSDTEGLPGVVLEAGYFGVPTVSTEVGGIKEALKDGTSGYITGKNVEELTEKANLLLQDESLRRLFGEAARKKVVKDFNVEKIAEQYLDFFKKISLQDF